MAEAIWNEIVWPSRWSAVLVGMGVVSQILIGRRSWLGYVVGVLTQFVWVGYGIHDHEYFFFVSAAVFTVTYVWYGRKWWLLRSATA